MRRALIVYASRHGGTAGIAARIRDALRSEDLEVVVAGAEDRPNPQGFDACIVGSGVYMGSWLKEGIEYLDRNADVLRTLPTWLFSSGPLPGSTKEQPAEQDPYEGALGPAEGPGSGGRKRIEALAAQIGVRGHRVFRGAYDPNDPAKTLSERFVRFMPGGKNILPEGDFREWDQIDAWAREIATALREPALAR